MHKNPEWMSSGTCTDKAYDPDMWFPDASGGARKAANKAKKLCQSCPVLTTCQEYAITYPVILTGIWGGMSEDMVSAERLRRNLSTIDEAHFCNLPQRMKAPKPDEDDEWLPEYADDEYYTEFEEE